MELIEAKIIIGGCMKVLEAIPQENFYWPAEESLNRAYQELDEAWLQYKNAVDAQEELRPPTQDDE